MRVEAQPRWARRSIATLSAASAVPVIVALSFALLACEAPVATFTPSPGAEEVDCQAVIEMSPAEAGEYLVREGWTVSWRHDTTTEEGVVSAIASEPPDGVITDVIAEDGVAIVFVTPSDDPLLDEVAVGEGCPDS